MPPIGAAASLTSNNFTVHPTTSLLKALVSKGRFFREMEDTTWFEEKSDDEKLTYMSELMYSDAEEASKEEFGTLLKLLPVDLVDGCNF